MLACEFSPVALVLDRPMADVCDHDDDDDDYVDSPTVYLQQRSKPIVPQSSVPARKSLNKEHLSTRKKVLMDAYPSRPLTLETGARTVVSMSPPLPPPPPPPPPLGLPKPQQQTLRRHQSEPTPRCPARRSIFGNNVWTQPAARLHHSHSTCCPHDCRDDGDSSWAETTATELTSLSPATRTMSGCDAAGNTIRKWLRPPPVRLMDKPHFVLLDQVPAAATESLPALPYPLRRFFENGARTQLGGVYPMVSPSPILRESSYTGCNAKKRSKQASFYTQESSSSTSSSSSSIMPSFNLTQTLPKGAMRKLLEEVDMVSGSSSSHHRSNSNSNINKSSEERKVRFDPRVMVTEFEDNAPRYWFNDTELERFKWETVRLVRRYLVANPSLIDDYNKPYLEPITGKYRRRALYSIPVLGADADEEELEQNRACADAMAKAHVRSILVAARNHLVLDLLSRSLKMIFPHAKITTATTGEEAIQAFCDKVSKKDRGFDLVLADGKLNKSNHAQARSLDAYELEASFIQAQKSRSMYDFIRSPPPVRAGNRKRFDNMTGAELFKQIEQIAAASAAANKESSLFAPNLCPLLIGLTTTPELEGKVMARCGASLVWAMPPPKMDERLRDEIVTALVQKRSAAIPDSDSTRNII